jgi:hypothetical protein
MLRTLIAAFALLTFTGAPTPASSTVAARGPGSPIESFYVSNKGSRYTPGYTFAVIESIDGSGSAFADVVLVNGCVVDVVIDTDFDNGGFTAPPVVTIIDTTGRGRGAVVFSVLEE